MPKTELDQQCINAIRVLTMDAVQKASSGHPGMPMGMADVAYILWTRHLRHNPQNPHWPNRDRFVLSAGHGSMLLYSLLHLTGYPISMEDLKQFRQWDSNTPGHPEYEPDLGVETTTGPLGQGFANGVGMAIAQKHLASRFNRPDYPIFDHFIYAIVSDGDLMEGISHEVASLAGHLGLDNLIYFYDDNEISIEGSTDLTFTEDVAARFQAYDWHVQTIDPYNMEAVESAIRAAQAHKGQPHLIICKGHIAYGSPNMQDSAKAHGAPLGEEEVRLTKETLDWPSTEPFFVPEGVIANYRLAIPRGEQLEANWRDMLTRYKEAYPDEAKELNRVLEGKLPEDWEAAIPRFRVDDPVIATRNASGEVLDALMHAIPEIIGGSADLAPSTKTYIEDLGDFTKDTPEGRNLHFGVREMGMGGIVNGMALYGHREHGSFLRPFGATFTVFSDYMRAAVRLSALMEIPVVYVWTHDSIFVGEDGPTHQPVEQVMSLRTIPNLTVLRPADANETAVAWKLALTRQGPTALMLTRQKLPILEEAADKAKEGVARGAYVISDSPLNRIDLILIATGSEVHVALEAQNLLTERRIGTRVVSMPSWEIFEEQPVFYKLSVLPDNVIKRLSIEAGVTLGWERYVGSHGATIGIDHFGSSAPYQTLQKEFGLTAQDVFDRAVRLMAE